MASRDSHYQASDEPVYEVDSFEMLWELHKGKIIAGIVAVLVVVGAVFSYMLATSSQKKAAAAAFVAASTPDAWRDVIENYPKSPVAGNAALLLAQSLRDEKKIDEANKVLSDFVATQPENQFAPLASLAIAENEALAGKLDDAETSLRTISDTDSKSFVAPFALMMEAELHLAQWDRNNALRSYELLYQNFSDSVSGDSSEQAYDALRAMARPQGAPASEPSADETAADDGEGEQAAPETQTPEN